jgi:hypothetical protein
VLSPVRTYSDEALPELLVLLDVLELPDVVELLDELELLELSVLAELLVLPPDPVLELPALAPWSFL